MLTLEPLFLRALEPEDIEVLFAVENDASLTPFSSHNGPYSKFMLRRYLEQQHQSIYEQQQQRLVIASAIHNVLGLIDLFDFEPKSRRAGVGIVVLKAHRNKGIATKALSLLEEYVIKHYAMHMLHADVLCANPASCRLFEKRKFTAIGIKKDWYYFEQKFHDVTCYQKRLTL